MKSKKLLALVLLMSFTTAYAQTAEDRVLNSDPIDVDGYLKEKQVTDGELEQIKSEIRKQKSEVVLNKEKSKGFQELSKTTEKLSESTEEYIDEKKNAQKDIAEYNLKIKCLMEEHPGRECDKFIRNRREEKTEVAPIPAPEVQEVAVVQAAPAPMPVMSEPTVLVQEAPKTGAAWEEIKLLPYAGATQYSGEVEQLEATFAAGLRLESNITDRLSLGIGLNMSQLKTKDFGGNNLYGNSGYGMDYNSMYGGREIAYRSTGFDIYSKFFITKGERFRPYIGVGLGYNRADVKYTNNQTQSFAYNANFGNENYKTSFATGQLMGGTEILITKTMGINIEAAYATGLGSSLSSSSSKNITNSPDQARLRTLGDEIINSSAVSIFAGAVVMF